MNPGKFLILAIAWAGIADAACGVSHAASKNDEETAKAAPTLWLTDYDAALKRAKADGKTVVVDFFATWCGPCQLMDEKTFADPRVRQRLKNFVTLKVDVDKQPELARRYGVSSLPTSGVLAADGKPLAGAAGYLPVDQFLKLLENSKNQRGKPRRGILGETAPRLR